jgi:hypothetical protein
MHWWKKRKRAENTKEKRKEKHEDENQLLENYEVWKGERKYIREKGKIVEQKEKYWKKGIRR